MKTISDIIFKKLAKNAIPEDSSLECVALKAKFLDYVIDFYAWKNKGYQLEINDFGYYENQIWINCTPSLKQIGFMQMLLSNELQRLESIENKKLIAEAQQIQFESDCYKYGEVGF